MVVRIKPSSGRRSGDGAVKKVSNDSVTVGDRKFTFDSVFDVNSTQVYNDLTTHFDFCLSFTSFYFTSRVITVFYDPTAYFSELIKITIFIFWLDFLLGCTRGLDK